MTTDETTKRRPGYPTANGRHVPTDVGDRAGVVVSALSDQVGSDPTAETTAVSDRDDPTDSRRPDQGDPTTEATGKATKKRKRPGRRKTTSGDDPTGEKRPRRLGRVVAWARGRGRRRESVETAARRAWLDDQGATVGIPRGYGWAFLALVVTTVVSAGAAFWFVFGNVTDTAAMVGVPWEQQRAVSPTIDILVIGLTVYVQYLVMANGRPTTVRLVRRLLVAASLLMLVMNATPPVLAALTTDYDGPLRRATEDFTPTFDQMTTGQLWGRAGLDVVITGILVAWSHWGPRVVAGLAEIKARADRAALRTVEERTFATEADRAAAADLRAQAAAALEAARAEATALVDKATDTAGALVASARAEATRLVDQATGERDQAARAARSASNTTAEATELRERAQREAAGTVEEAKRAADRARAAVDQEREQLATERRQLDEQRAALARERDELAEDRRALEALADEITAAPAVETPPAATPSTRSTNGAPSAGAPPRAPKQPTAGTGKRRPRSETIPEGVAAWKDAHGDDWWKVDPKKAEIMTIAKVHGELAIEIRRQIVLQGKGAAAGAGETYAYQ